MGGNVPPTASLTLTLILTLILTLTLTPNPIQLECASYCKPRIGVPQVKTYHLELPPSQDPYAYHPIKC